MRAGPTSHGPFSSRCRGRALDDAGLPGDPTAVARTNGLARVDSRLPPLARRRSHEVPLPIWSWTGRMGKIQVLSRLPAVMLLLRVTERPGVCSGQPGEGARS